MRHDREPRVSVVTPFYNTAEYLAECIESVLAQSYSNYEYLLVNNKSTDGSREIAQQYAAKDSRIRLIDNDVFVSQGKNYNGALRQIDGASKYVKMVQADDFVFPGCLSQMVELAEREPTVGLVSAYYFFGRHLDGGGIDYRTSRLDGREACRQMLVQRRSFVGSATTVLYRADIVRSRQPFFREIPYFTDMDAAFEILSAHDLGFVHQLLSFTRVENESVMSPVRDFEPMTAFYFAATEYFGPRVLTQLEFEKARSEIKRDYYKHVGKRRLRRSSARFFKFQQAALEAFGQKIEKTDVLAGGLRELVRIVLNPGGALAQAWRDRQSPR